MKLGTVLLYGSLSVLLLLWLALSISVYLRLPPPESVVLVALRMPYQMLSRYLTAAGGAGAALYAAGLWLRGGAPRQYSLLLAVGFGVCCGLGCLYALRIRMAAAQVSGMPYGKAKKNDTSYEIYREDLHEKMQAAQCSVATPVGSPSAKACVVYLNYGGWSAQDERMGAYLERLVMRGGYSYVRLAGIGKEQGNISDIVKAVKKHLKALTEEKQYRKMVLVGGSAGGNIALLTAFSGSLQEVYGAALPVDGVIALYPMTDMESAYRYFVEQARADTLLGVLGDRLYCALCGSASKTGTLAGETRALDEAVFGAKAGAESLYHAASVVNLVEDQNIPTLLIAGSADSMVVVQDTKRLYACMAEKGMDAAYLELPNVEHAFDLADNAARRRACVEMQKWLAAVLAKA